MSKSFWESDLKLLRFEAKEEYDLDVDFSEAHHMQEMVLRRQSSIDHIKDRKKSRQQKRNFRQNKQTYKKGIKRFHASTEGKRFHRTLGRYVATRARKDEGVIPKLEFLRMKSHLSICDQYIVPTPMGQAEWDLMYEDCDPRMTEILYSLEQGGALDEDSMVMILTLLNPKIIEEMKEQNLENIKFVELCTEALGVFDE